MIILIIMMDRRTIALIHLSYMELESNYGKKMMIGNWLTGISNLKNVIIKIHVLQLKKLINILKI